MLKAKKKIQVFALILLTTALLVAAINPNIASVKAQAQATVNVLDSVGGTISPSGTTTYADGTVVSLLATPDSNYIFAFWTVSTNQYSIQLDTNPAPLTVSGGVTYSVQPVFTQIFPLPGSLTPTPDYSTAAIVVVLNSVGGTTSPAPGTYAMENAASTTLTATPDSGWQFSHWVISGPTDTTHGGVPFTLTPTDNPYTVGHGYGYTYYYQPVFIPTGSTSTTTPTPTVPEFSSAAAIITAMVLVIVAFGAYTFNKKPKK